MLNNKKLINYLIVRENNVNSYLKNFDIDNAFHRLNMVELAIEDYPYFDVSAIEYTRNTLSYTYDTILRIRNYTKTQAKINFIIGKGGARLIF